MKKILFFLFVCFSITAYAQLDREHWFAPMYDGQSNSGDEQFLHLSTNETTPFNVNVYSNNLLVAKKTISKGNPGVIVIKYNPGLNEIDRDNIITDEISQLHKVINKGLYIKADKPCFANLRFGVTNHTEIITSKGTAGIGTKFYTVVAPSAQTNPSSSENLGFAASFLATEDNTRVTVNNFKKPLIFNNYGATTSFTFILSKGESYIIDGRISNLNNRDGFIGAEVNADKPISMSNGNFNGQYASTINGDGSDILMDQSVPVDKLGDEFVIVKGYGIIGNKMEGAIVVATEPNTAVYLNDATIPARILANPGDFFKVEETSYVDRGNQHFNLHIVTDKNVYVYQLLAGVASGSAPLATGGMNYIPPLNCYLPKKIDEISYINYLSNVPHNPPFSTKLNIITEKNAVVKVNGVVPSILYGPYDISTITANQNWVSYSVPNVTGNITVESTKAVTAGIASGNAAFGYGGYFAGFSSIPLILKTDGDCLPGVTLEVTEGFDLYEWLIKNAGGTYDPAPGVNNLFQYEPTQAGIYAVRVKQGSCAEIQTKDFKFFNCTTFTNYDFDTCSTQTITPQFALSSQSINIPTIVIDTPPTKGNVVKNPDGTLTYTANPNATGTDTFKFSFCGIGTIPDCEAVQATIHLNQIENYDVVLNECSATSTATYNLTTAAITPDATVIKKYFTDAAFTNQIPAAQLNNYTSAPGFVYVQLNNAFGCSETAKIELKITSEPVVTPSLYTQQICDEDIDGMIDGNYKVNLTAITPTIVQNPSAFVVKYYATQPQAIAGGTNNITGNYTFTANTSVWIRVESPSICPPVIKEVFLTTGTKAALITQIATIPVCDLLENNTEPVTLSDYISLFTIAAGNSATYYDTIANAQNNQNAINVNQTITGNRTFYYRINIPGFCANIGTLNIEFKKGTPSTTLPLSVTVCQGNTTTLNVGSGYSGILWSTGSTSTTITVGAGNYYVDLTNASGCVYRQNVTVVDSPKPTWNIAAYNATNCDDDFDGIIKVNLNNVTPLILPNFASFTVEYFSDSALTLPIANPANFTYSANTTIFVRATSTVCPTESRPIDFKFGISLPLIKPIETTTICDNDLNNSENINLGNYRTLFTADATATIKYFATLANAQNNTTAIPAAQTITADKTFYYRFTKAGFCDVIGTLNISFKASTPTALLNSYTVCAGSSQTLTAESTYTAYLWKKGATTVSTTQTAVLSGGVYTVSFTNASGCVFTKNITILESPKPIWKVATYNATNCDDNFDGIIAIDLTKVTPVVLPNFTLFTVEYFTDASLLNPITNLINWTYSANTTIYVRASSPYCPAETKSIDFKFGNNLPLIKNDATVKVCDDDFDGIKSVNLSSYISEFTTDSGVTVSYFGSLADAQNSVNTISSAVTVTSSGIYYLRFHKNLFCDVIGKLTVNIQKAVKSDILKNKDICPDATTTLDAGAGFDNYLWSTGEKTQTINVPVGNYWVELTTNGCTYKQNVSVKAVSLPTITSVEIKGSTVTVTVTGGNPPYQYAIDNGNYQSSNIFTNVRGGDHTIYVISADNCTPVSANIDVIELYNVITPNGDGMNDILNYSALLKKEEPFIQIYDRYGKLVFTGDKNNRYSWDGKAFGKLVNTESYWYIMKWKEPGFSTVMEYSGWILVKNR